MDLSALIFVALAVAWAVYLVPKALRHHDEVQRSRSVERFSHRMRVLARREPVGRRSARLVVTPFRPSTGPRVETKPSAPSAPASASPSSSPAPRSAAAVAARRRRRVLGTLLLAVAVVVGLAVAGVITWPWVAIPAGLVVAWLVACRLMVRRERSARPGRLPVVPAAGPTRETDVPLTGEVSQDDAELTGEAPVEAPVAQPVAQPVADAAPAPGQWDMVPMTLPTYVDKPAAERRTVHTIDLDSTGVWSSGRSERDSELAREAEQADRAAREQARARRASGA